MKILGKTTKREEQIYQLITLVAGGFALGEVLDKLARAAVEITGASACSIRLLDDEAGDLKMRSTFGLSEEYRNKGPVTREDPVIQAAFAGEAVIIDDMSKDERVKYKDASEKEGIVSQLTVAMQFKNTPVGVLRLYRPRVGGFTEDDISLIRSVASQCAVAITNAKYYSRALAGEQVAQQVRLASIVQRRMIPESAPDIKGLDIASIYKPCFGVGGDLYDFIRLDEDTLAIAIADVIGKGIPAALMMSSFRGMIRAYADGGHMRHTMTEIIRKLNSNACQECRDGEFITLFYAIIDAKDMTITYCNCGHEPTLLWRGGKIRELQKGGLVLGVTKDAEYEIEKINLKNEDRLLFYTDGLIDAVNFDGKIWGVENLFKTFKQCAPGNARDIVNNTLTLRRRFIGLARQTDDTSMVVVRVSDKNG
ncbi:MAG: Phosphoserine phosphatase RsbU [Planctomycetes bacterium ADurb.Bin401]|nr:MAG: Phosphoserine phosphatase RsbU [Planctomycetes bacterium ADurb.Bin401]